MVNLQLQRRSHRRRQVPDRLQLGEGVRAGQELAWERMQRRRVEDAERRDRERAAQVDNARQIAPPPAPQPPAAPPAALLDTRPAVQIIFDHRKYATKDKACTELTFLQKIPSFLSFLLLSLYFGCKTEFSERFCEQNFELEISALNNLHSKNFPFNPQERSVLSVYTSDLIREFQTPFLFKLADNISVFSVSIFLRAYFKLSLLSDRFLKKLALLCFPAAAALNEHFLIGALKANFASAEIQAVQARYFCFKCMACFAEESALLSHVNHSHNWAMEVKITEEDSTAIKDRDYLIGMSKWNVSKSHRTMVADEHGANAHVARYQEVEIQGLVDGQRHGEAVRLCQDGVQFQGHLIPNPEE